ncbi:MAG TPA: hypothetical protein GXX25_00550 [Desulfotomaculum sp.]|nr:hypothetical protein [Desulfofundulus thermobenzoicus]HHW42300.1 hypothetical protein [Desulfotomaculum sp.]
MGPKKEKISINANPAGRLEVAEFFQRMARQARKPDPPGGPERHGQ